MSAETDPTGDPASLSKATLVLGPGMAQRAEAAFAFCVAAFCVVLVLTNIIGVKLFLLFPDGRPSWYYGEGPMTLTAGIITYPITFLLTDLVSEIWGHKKANLMVKYGFVMSFLMLLILQVGLRLEPSNFWTVPLEGGETGEQMEHAFQLTFYFPGLLLFASMLAYLVAQLFDVRLYHFWWKLTGGKFMWLRNNGSTSISQLVDTIIVNSIYLHWGLKMDWPTVFDIIVAVYIAKLILAAFDTPLIYFGKALMFRFLGIPPQTDIRRAPLAA